MMRRRILDLRRCAAVAVVACASGCEQQPPPTPTAKTEGAPKSEIQSPDQKPAGAESREHSPLHFTDITAESGIDCSITCGGLPSNEILEVNGGGLALIDFNNDGHLDLFVANGATMDDPERGPGCQLFQNLGGFKFRDVTHAAAIDIHCWATGAAVGDYDGDGFDDIFVCCYGPNILLRNLGDGRFAEVTIAAFGETPGPQPSLPEWSTSAAFGDIDNDGDLDLYVCNYLDFDLQRRPAPARHRETQVMGGPHGLPPQHDVLWENLGDGTFRDVTVESGCRAARPSFGLNVVIIDFDADGRQDITVANDSMPDFFFHNIGGQRPEGGDLAPIAFKEIGILSGLASNADGSNQASMGIAVADVNGNGRPDKFTTVFSSDTNALHLNLNGGIFEDRAQQYGLALVSRAALGWAAGFFDFDHDGDEDLLYVNGHVYPQATPATMDSEYQQPPMLFERVGPRFRRVAADAGGEWLNHKHRDRNAVFADFDGDGDIDVIIGELNGPIRVLRNDAPRDRRWLIVKLNDHRPESRNPHAYGSRIELTVTSSDSAPMRQTRWMFTGGGFQSSGAPYVHFGLGQLAANARVSLSLRWPDGYLQHIEHVEIDQRLILSR